MIDNQIKIIQAFIIALLLFPMLLFAQSSNIGTFPIYNFNKENHNGSSQNWDIAQDNQGVMYFANNAGLLAFDGVYWQCHQVRNQTNVRAVAVREDGKIFVGAQGEIGYFSPNEQGKLVYTSLNPLLAEKDKTFADVWDIEIIGQQVYFRTGNNIFHYNNQRIKVIFNAASLNLMSKANETLYVYEQQQGILELKDSTFQPFYQEVFFQNMDISGIIPFQKDTLLISTLENGLFLCTQNSVQEWSVNAKSTFQQGRVFAAERINDTTFAIGTASKGVLIINKQEQVIWHINQKLGLQVNNVLNLFVDNFKNLWVGLDNGIDYIEISSPFTYIYPEEGLKAMSYAAQIHNNRIYLGTSNGLFQNAWQSYYNPLKKTPYQLVKGTEGQVWNLGVFENDLLLNHHNGIFKIVPNIAKSIFDANGSWMQLSLGNQKLLNGDYNGLSILEKNSTWEMPLDFYSNWRESCRIMVLDEKGYVWVSHPYRGVFKVQFDKEYSKITQIDSYNSTDGFPSDLQIYVFKINKETVFCTPKGIYTYNEAENRFEPNEEWNAIFGANTWVKRLIEAPNGDVWYVIEDEVGVLEVNDKSIYKEIKKRTFPQLRNQMVDNFEHIYPYDDENVFIATEDCFIHYNPQKIVVDTSFNTLIRFVQIIKNDSTIYHGNIGALEKSQIISYKTNDLKFGFSATHFASIENNEFQYYLEGFNENWSDWTTKADITYTNLKAGKYTFHVRAKNINGVVSEAATFSFRIAPPWYATSLAFGFYALLVGGLLFSLIFIPKKQFEKEKAALQEEQAQVLLQKEREKQVAKEAHQQRVSELEKEKLELQIQAKNQELASSTLHLVQKGEILQKIKTDIQRISKLSTEPSIVKELKKVIRKVSVDENLDKDWEQFTQHFDQVHGQFLQRLRVQHPNLTPKDYRLCAYLRMNLSSKEIAPLINISVRSVEVARYRLRKKLGLGGDVNLVEFLMNV